MIRSHLVFYLALSSTVVSQDFLDPLYVTASRMEINQSDLPYTAAYISPEFLQDQQVRTLPEALKLTPGVLIQKTAHGHGSPFIRGFTGRQNLLLVDGVRVNNSTYRAGPVQYWNTVDALAIDHIEVIKSQGSVLYGSDAIGGTVNATTRSSRFLTASAGQPYVGGSSYYEYRSNGQGSHLGRIEAETGVGGKFGILLGISAKEFGDIEDSAVGRMRSTGYPEENLDLRFDWAVTPDSTITLAQYYLNQDDISRWHRTLDNPGWNHGSHVAAPGKWTADTYDQERSLTYLRYAGEAPEASSFIRRWNATLSFQQTDDSEFQNRFPDSPATDTGVLRSASILTDSMGFDLTLESEIGPGNLVYGFDYYHDEVESAGFRSDALGGPRSESLPIADDSEYDLAGAFTQYVWKTTDRLEITGGVS